MSWGTIIYQFIKENDLQNIGFHYNLHITFELFIFGNLFYYISIVYDENNV